MKLPGNMQQMMRQAQQMQEKMAQDIAQIKVTATAGEAASGPVAAAPLPKPAAEGEDEVTGRALANPEVQRFREVFGGEVRKVRNLKE